jgi:hypothetical protein
MLYIYGFVVNRFVLRGDLEGYGIRVRAGRGQLIVNPLNISFYRNCEVDNASCRTGGAGGDFEVIGDRVGAAFQGEG